MNVALTTVATQAPVTEVAASGGAAPVEPVVAPPVVTDKIGVADRVAQAQNQALQSYANLAQVGQIINQSFAGLAEMAKGYWAMLRGKG